MPWQSLPCGLLSYSLHSYANRRERAEVAFRRVADALPCCVILDAWITRSRQRDARSRYSKGPLWAPKAHIAPGPAMAKYAGRHPCDGDVVRYPISAQENSISAGERKTSPRPAARAPPTPRRELSRLLEESNTSKLV